MFVHICSPNSKEVYYATRRLAWVAELVDALVSNTNAFGRAGSTPAPGTEQKPPLNRGFFYLPKYHSSIQVPL